MFKNHLFSFSTSILNSKHMEVFDGNQAASHGSYFFSDCSFIYPITPSSPMAENMDVYSAMGKKNLFGETVKVVEMQSELGAAGALHGSINTGCITSTFTSSQGLMLMVPNLFKIASEGSPAVIHVAARTMIRSLGSLFLDHSDVMSVRITGIPIINSSSVQEALDMAIISHISALKGKVPFLHFFDGFRTSHACHNIEVLDDEDVKPLLNLDDLESFRKSSFNPEHPTYRGGATGEDIFWQWFNLNQGRSENLINILKEKMKEFEKISGRKYDLFEYYGDQEAENIVVIMGSSARTAREYVEYFNKRGEKIGVIQVRLFRPWSSVDFIKKIPKSCKKICVMDRCLDIGSKGPLYLDINTTLKENKIDIDVIDGTYGIAGFDFTPGMLHSVFENLKSENSIRHFKVGINDDVFNQSLNYKDDIKTTNKDAKELVFIGRGGDGTVGANKESISIISKFSDKKHSQAYFTFEAKKTNGYTMTHLRFSNDPINSEYEIKHADYVAVHHPSYVSYVPVLDSLKDEGIFVLNSPWESIEEIEKNFPNELKKKIYDKKVKFYNIDATQIAKNIGLEGRINMIMQSVFFKLNDDLVDVKTSKKALIDGVKKIYKFKGKKILEMNIRTIEEGYLDKNLKKIEIPENWGKLDSKNDSNSFYIDGKLKIPKLNEKNELPREEYVEKIIKPYLKMKGKEMPSSFFLANDFRDGNIPTATSKFEKRTAASNVPFWDKSKCIKCNTCGFVCPQACIRPILLTDKELKNVLKDVPDLKYLNKSKQTKDYNYSIQVSVRDCLECGLCVESCPKNALSFKSILEMDIEKESKRWDVVEKLAWKGREFEKYSIVGSQFQKPYLEFPGCCGGCPEAQNFKILTQLFGNRMMVANATGCSIIWTSNFPTNSISLDQNNHGPTWGNSLFEDNAEYGFGIALAVQQKRKMLKRLVEEAKSKGFFEEISETIDNWIKFFSNGEKSKELSFEINKYLEKNKDKFLNNENKDVKKLMRQIYMLKDVFTKPSVWIIGGDGWAYDIGFGGLDHVLASNVDVKCFVYDNQSYANTGFQMSKSTPLAAKEKFAYKGKEINAKNLALQMMQYGHVYVGSVSSGADRNHFIKIIKEAEAYDGPALIVSYCPCTGNGIEGGMKNSIRSMKDAVKSGFWSLFHYNPKNRNNFPFKLDFSRKPTGMKEFLKKENRFTSLVQAFPNEAKLLQEKLEKSAEENYEKLIALSKIKNL